MKYRHKLATLIMAHALILGAMLTWSEGAYSIDFTLESDTGEKCTVKFDSEDYKTKNTCKIPGNRPEVAITIDGGGYVRGTYCALDKNGARQYCLLGMTGGNRNVRLLLTDPRDTVTLNFGVLKYSEPPYNTEKIEYSPFFTAVELYPRSNLQGSGLCVIALSLGDSKRACDSTGYQARSARIIGLPDGYSRHKLCLRTPKDESNRCISTNSTPTSAAFPLMNIDGKDSPAHSVEINVKGGNLSGSLYSIDSLE